MLKKTKKRPKNAKKAPKSLKTGFCEKVVKLAYPYDILEPK